MTKRIKPGDKCISFPIGFLDEIELKIEYQKLSDTQVILEQVVTGIFEGVFVSKDGLITYGFKLVDIEATNSNGSYFFNDYRRISASELERIIKENK